LNTDVSTHFITTTELVWRNRAIKQRYLRNIIAVYDRSKSIAYLVQRDFGELLRVHPGNIPITNRISWDNDIEAQV
jgi:hypothetical protein